MTRIDFHLEVADSLHYTCRLIRKAYGSGLKIVCYSSQNEVLSQLDELLWTFSAEDFIPHAKTGHPELAQCPVVLTDKADDVRHYDLLINLDDECPSFFSRFDRLVEIVGQEEASKAKARNRFRFYKDRGYPLETYNRKGK